MAKDSLKGRACECDAAFRRIYLHSMVLYDGGPRAPAGQLRRELVLLL
jgi:hypothetical protein